MREEPNLRRSERSSSSAKLRVCWQDRLGRDRFAVVRSFDISRAGIRIELPERIEPGSSILLQSPELRLHGAGSVRHCRRVDGKYIVGVEFVGALRPEA